MSPPRSLDFSRRLRPQLALQPLKLSASSVLFSRSKRFYSGCAQPLGPSPGVFDLVDKSRRSVLVPPPRPVKLIILSPPSRLWLSLTLYAASKENLCRMGKNHRSLSCFGLPAEYLCLRRCFPRRGPCIPPFFPLFHVILSLLFIAGVQALFQGVQSLFSERFFLVVLLDPLLAYPEEVAIYLVVKTRPSLFLQ